ncbi:hypothetical protein A3H66_02455 [Candidatus Falkowbacteria bacterium RIFCSPLOWO2_02_FULL_45_21]|uniref:Uncharacterized protein n=1 Tax=Candidatus Falkowbacteria bacterium RIFCSPLOWO2_02_FULL_45_21 TaxID=1797989 RepID=A0A1F5SB60_9BACT|nr:MAG: hypothetical protein A3H66_02455 [Candidatus Falkowbacteria bacterium RIFCSPLOWO2_02_FULL_45_21]
MPLILLKIFSLAFLVNLLWEVSHSVLYKTCLELPLPKYVKLIIKASLKDAFFITLFYLITVLIFKNFYILQNYFQLAVFVFICLLFSFFDEIISLKYKRWQYAEQMPKIFGVGLTPFLELAVTGLIIFKSIFHIAL